MAAVSIVTNNFFALFFLEFHFCIECDYTHAKKSAFLSFFLKIKISPTCPLKKNPITFTDNLWIWTCVEKEVFKEDLSIFREKPIHAAAILDFV